MTNWPFPPAKYIDTTKVLYQFVDAWAAEPLLAIDTESNSMHAYHERVCLIQLSTRSADYIIDPLTIEDLSPLGILLAAPAIEKVFHAAEYDLMCLKRDYNFEVRNLFDTMLAARMCGYKAVGLNNLLSTHFNVAVDKSHQRDNWGERPLSADSLLYAQMDTHYLPQLRDILYDELAQGGHLTEAGETFAEVCEMTPAHDGRTVDPDGFWKIGMPQHLNPHEMAILRELYFLREQIAEERDLPPFKIFHNQVLVEIARAAPTSHHDLHHINGTNPGLIRRYGDEILAAVARGKKHRVGSPPPYRPPPPEVSDLYTALHHWRKERALQRGVESDVIISKQALWTLAQRVPESLSEMQDIQGLGPWRLRTYGEEILRVITQFPKFSNGKL